jgi:hypothetical protein
MADSRRTRAAGGGEARIGLNAVIVAVTAEAPRILTLAAEAPDGPDALPFGPLDPAGDRTLEQGLRRWVGERAGLELGYVEQLYTFGDRFREPGETSGGPRLLSVAYLALVREARTAGGAAWRGVYEFFPWEDWRGGKPPSLESELEPALASWAKAAGDRAVRQGRRERIEIAFGLGGAPWDGERVLDRYELLYEVGLVAEAWRDRPKDAIAPRVPAGGPPRPRLQGRAMAVDHRRILATALGRLRGKLRYRPVVFELLPPTFTLLQLQRVVEALAGVRLHKQNFRRVLETGRLVEGTGRRDVHTGGRPAERFRFRREVLRERPAPGVGLPGVRS